MPTAHRRDARQQLALKIGTLHPKDEPVIT
jgi:hypothetical protein